MQVIGQIDCTALALETTKKISSGKSQHPRAICTQGVLLLRKTGSPDDAVCLAKYESKQGFHPCGICVSTKAVGRLSQESGVSSVHMSHLSQEGWPEETYGVLSKERRIVNESA